MGVPESGVSEEGGLLGPDGLSKGLWALLDQDVTQGALGRVNTGRGLWGDDLGLRRLDGCHHWSLEECQTCSFLSNPRKVEARGSIIVRIRLALDFIKCLSSQCMSITVKGMKTQVKLGN